MAVEVHDLLAYDGLKILQRKDLFRFSLDALLLADFTSINPRVKRIIDLGTGLGPIPLYLSLKTDKPIIGIDIQSEMIDLARQSATLNNLDAQLRFEVMDITKAHQHYESHHFDLITANPPFFKVHHQDFLNQLDALTIARHEVQIDFSGLVSAVRRLLASGGSFCFIHRAHRLDEIMNILHEHRFACKRMRFVHTVPDKAATMVLIDARPNGKTGDLSIMPPLVIYDSQQNYTEDAQKIFHFGDESYGTNI